LAAGHRPCATCRRADYVAYRDAVDAGGRRSKAFEVDRRLASERLRRGRGLARAGDRPLWTAALDALPVGAVVVRDGRPHLVGTVTLQPFGFGGWGPSRPRDGGEAAVLTPPTSVAALAGGFRPTLHPSAADGAELSV
ncbi:MAG TPA: hypothetical protein VFT09_04185, partial [Ilumatobacteraceae bacterium]|nr:hypothetical protein [Ilumatobacteraceae bacterium]